MKRTNPFDALRSLSRRPPKTPEKAGKSIQKEGEPYAEEVIYQQRDIKFKEVLNSTLLENGTLLIRLDHNEEFVFKGAVLIAAVYGHFDILGFEFKPSPNGLEYVPVYSPSTNSFLTLRASPTQSEHDSSNSIGVTHNQKEVLIAVKSLKNGIFDLESQAPIFRHIFSINKTESEIPFFYPLDANDNNPYHLKGEIEQALNNIKGLVHCIVGPVNSGKSNLSRYFSNVLLKKHNRVVYFDCDLGQPELQPSGTISLTIISKPLLGPPFSHTQIAPFRCLFIGAASAKQDPDGYMSGLIELISVYYRDLSDLPLVVNTSGWVKGVGYDLLMHLITALKPDNLILLDQYDNLNANALVSNVDKHVTLIRVDAVRDDQRVKLNAQDQRNLVLTSYFHHKGSDWDFSETLSSQAPFQVPMSILKVKFLHEEVPFSQSHYALNGTLVGLVVDSTRYHQPHSKQSLGFIPTHTPLLQNCVGIGLIRAIDLEKGLVYILSSVPLEEIKLVNLLLRGSLDFPIALSTQGYLREKLPYTTFNELSGLASKELKNRHLGRKKGSNI